MPPPIKMHMIFGLWYILILFNWIILVKQQFTGGPVRAKGNVLGRSGLLTARLPGAFCLDTLTPLFLYSLTQ